MPNGVICGGAVDGSSQVGEIVTCHAMTARPDGSAAAALPPNARKVASKKPANARTRFIGPPVRPRGRKFSGSWPSGVSIVRELPARGNTDRPPRPVALGWLHLFARTPGL